MTGGDSLKLNLIVVLTGMFDLTKVEEFSKRIFSELELSRFTINLKKIIPQKIPGIGEHF